MNNLNAVKYMAAKSLIYVLVLTAVLFWAAGPAQGIVLHPDGEPNLVTWTDRPADDVVGRWGTKAACVVVSSNCVITVRHAGGGTGTSVTIGGKKYTIAQIWNHSTADLRVIKLYDANLASFVDVYEDTNEAGESIVMGAWGKGRGAILQTSGVTYGYGWDSSYNTTLRFGTNGIDGTQDNDTIGAYTSDIVIADFDGLGEWQSTLYESAVADHDSGGGWFIVDGNDWQVAGLSRAVEVHYQQGHEDDPNYFIYESWFRERDDPNELHPDYLDAVRLSSYAQWINQILQQAALPGNLNGDNRVDFRDFAILAQYWLSSNCHAPDWCHEADFEPDGDVDWADLAEFASYWLQD